MRERRSTGLSVAFHAAVIGSFILLSRVHAPVLAPQHMAGTARGTAILPSYQLAGAPPGVTAAHAAARKAGAARPQPHKTTAPKPSQVISAPPVEAPAGNAGEGSLGDGDISIALVQFHPRPEPDPSTLPADGGDVVLDVVIDAAGHIAQLSVDKSLGAAVDRQVIATVQTWTFTPAKRNGTPIASEQQLLFHYDRSQAG